MPPPPGNPDPVSPPQPAALSGALCFFTAVIVAGLSYQNIQFAAGVQYFMRRYEDTLGKASLPPMTAFVVHHSPLFLVSAFIFPLMAIALIFVGGSVRSLFLCGCIILAQFCEMFFQWHALMVLVQNSG